MTSQLGCRHALTSIAAITTKRFRPSTPSAGSSPPARRRALHATTTTAASMTTTNNNGTSTGGRLDPSNAVVFVCDVQERFRSVIDGFPHCVVGPLHSCQIQLRPIA
jgi:hypothetical protein